MRIYIISIRHNSDPSHLPPLSYLFPSIIYTGKGHLTTIKIQIPADDTVLHHEYFTTSGLMIIERNWLDIYSKFEHWSANKIPVFKGKLSLLVREML